MCFTTSFLVIFSIIFYTVVNVLANEKINIETNKNNDILTRLMNLNQNNTCIENQTAAWCLPQDYDQEKEPWKFRNVINMSMPWFYYLHYKVFDLREVDDTQQTVALDLNFKIKWYEPRIEINFTDAILKEQVTRIDKEDHINLPLKTFRDFWIPDSEIYSIKKYRSVNILTPTATFRVNKNKLMRYVARVNVILSCKMDFENYPFDSQNCSFRQGSFYNPMEVVNCTSKVYHYKNLQRSLQYDLRILDLPPELNTWDSEGLLWATCGFMIELKRQKTQVFFQVYFTSILLVVISWVSFIIDPDAIPGRMGLLVGLFLMLITVFMNVKILAPTTSGFLNAVDEFLVVCIAEIFGAFLEYAFVLHFNKRCSQKHSTPKKIEYAPNQPQSESKTKFEKLINGWIEELQTPNSTNRYNVLDRLSIVVFPTSFFIFVIGYFSLYYFD